MRPGDTVIVRRAGDVIPEVVGPVLRRATQGARPWKFPTTCPCPRSAARSSGPRARADTRCVDPRLPVPATGAHRALRVARRAWTSRASASSGSRLFAGGWACSHDIGRHLRPRLGAVARARGVRRASRSPTCSRGDRGVEAAAARQPAGRAQHPPPRAGRHPRRCRGRSATSIGSWPRARRLAAVDGRRPGHRRARCTPGSPTRRTWRSSRSCAQPASTSRDRSPATAVLPQVLAGKAVVVVRAPSTAGRATRRGRDQGTRRQVAGQRVEEDDARRGRRRTRRVEGRQGRGARRAGARRVGVRQLVGDGGTSGGMIVDSAVVRRCDSATSVA